MVHVAEPQRVRREHEHTVVRRVDRRPDQVGVRVDSDAIGDVADGGDDGGAMFVRHRAEADLDRELRPVATAPGELEAGAHEPDLRLDPIAGPVGGMDLTEPIGQQLFDLAAEQLFAAVAEHRFELTVDDEDHAVLVSHHHPVGGRLDHPPDPRLRQICERREPIITTLGKLVGRGLGKVLLNHGTSLRHREAKALPPIERVTNTAVAQTVHR